MRTAVAVAIAAFLAGVVHGCVARDVALHPSVRAELELQVGGAAIDRIGVIGRHEPIRLQARLTEDAADAGEFVSLHLESLALSLDNQWRSASGGLVLSVNGTVERSRIQEWRAGRTIEAPVTFRR